LLYINDVGMIQSTEPCAPRRTETGEAHLMTSYIKLAIATAAVLLFSAAPALAYQESSTNTDPGSTPAYACPSCHGIESGVSSPTVAPRPDGGGTRKGPHGGYSTGTNKCETCHTLHGAASARMLLPELTISATCNTCHDGTGGGGVYGVIKRRTGQDPSGHRIGVATDGKVLVPGGSPSGDDVASRFSSENGGLTCTDCHDPHDGNTVEPFIGDRVRSANDTTTAIATNRLLRKRPTSTDTTVTAYGSDWCEACHKGSHTTGGTSHPIADATSTPSADYMHVQRMSAYDTDTVDPTKRRLGGSNLGYVVPKGSGGKPFCQQCHEDARDIANDPARPFVIDGTTEDFEATLDGSVDGNPTFQNFPHETLNSKMLSETRDSLCLNCHSPSGPDGP